EGAPRDDHTRRSAPRDAVAMAKLRAMPAPRATGVRAVAVIRWGRDASSAVLRKRARCTRCGHKGATVQHPGPAAGYAIKRAGNALSASRARMLDELIR